MPRTFKPQKNSQVVEFQQFFKPVQDAMINMPKLESQGNRPLQMTFEDHLKALVYFHLEEHHSAQHLLQVLEQDDFARNQIAPEDGIKKSSFSEATNCRGLEQFFYVFENLQAQVTHLLPKKHPELGTLVHYREIDVGEASEPEGCSSRSLPNSITRAVITDFTD